MATPSRALILDHVQAALSALGTVQRTFRDWGEVGKGEMPWLGCWLGKTTFQHTPGREIRAIAELRVLAHVNHESPADRAQALAAMEDAIIAALNVDITRGGAALGTFLEASETEGQDDTIDSRGGTGTLGMLFRIIYFRTADAT